MLPKQGRAASYWTLQPPMQTTEPAALESAMLLFERTYLPYVDINPHKSKPKWPAYVGLIVLLVATIAVVVHVLTNH